MQKKSSKPPSEASEHKIQWHPGFVAAMKLELRNYNDQLIFREEHLLNPKPIQIDLLVIEKTAECHPANSLRQLLQVFGELKYQYEKYFSQSVLYFAARFFSGLLTNGSA